jgi:hypothetical protein
MFVFELMPIMVFLVFFLVIGVFIVTAVKGIGEWNKNNHSPRLTVPATVVAKRTNVTRHHRHGARDVGYTTRSTTYYVTFQFASGDRMEMHITGPEYGMLVEGDRGDLTFQGTRYLGFVRK